MMPPSHLTPTHHLQAQITMASDIILSGLFGLLKKKIEMYGATQREELNADVTLSFVVKECCLSVLELLNNEGEEIKGFKQLLSRNAG